jgi:ABC-2 type transport system ATP-binding protein
VNAIVDHEVMLDFTGVRFGYGREPVLDGFDLELRAGEIVLLAAPNGTGKTTALWLAAGLLAPSCGSVRLFGRDPFRDRTVLDRVGFVAEGAPLPESWSGDSVLAFQRDSFSRWDEGECNRLIRSFRLDTRKRVRELSRGQRGKLALAAVLASRPELLLLDEPTLGLDVATRRVLLSEMLARVAEHGCPILLTGHEIAEAEALVERIVLVDHGRVVHDERIDELLARYRILAWESPTPVPPPALDLVYLPWALGKRALAQDWDEDVARLWLAQGGRVERADLETVYLALTGELAHA